MIVCPKCGTQNPEDANFCSRCGGRLVLRDLSETTVTYAPTATDEAGAVSRAGSTVGQAPLLLIMAGGGERASRFSSRMIFSPSAAVPTVTCSWTT